MLKLEAQPQMFTRLARLCKRGKTGSSRSRLRGLRERPAAPEALELGDCVTIQRSRKGDGARITQHVEDQIQPPKLLTRRCRDLGWGVVAPACG